ncbi:MAG: hypothetical protein IT456_01635 [Planctomycetes bacterium]|nr:hypothetical protein [Planctomycetota bacterium]
MKQLTRTEGGHDRLHPKTQHGVALLAVLFALTLLAVLALPFAVSMGVGADAAQRDVERVAVHQAVESVRDLLLADAALSHAAFDPTPTYDSLSEYPDHPDLPEKFQLLRDEGRVLLGGSVADLQRKISLDSVSPLVLTNLLGSTTHLSQELLPDATLMALDDVTALPEQGFVWVANEVVRYSGKQGNNLIDLQRGMFQELGFAKPEEAVAETALVLDYRCVIAAAWPFLGRGEERRTRRPFAAVSELVEIATAGIGAFSQNELDTLEASLSPYTMAATAASWGRPERVFNALQPGERQLRVKSALHVGAGSTVRLRDTKTGVVEYGLVMAASNEQAVRDLLLPSVFRLELLMPVTQAFSAIDTLVEPLVPAPVNVNTASGAVLLAMFAEVRRAPNVRVHESDGRQRQTPMRGISRSDAKALADEIETVRQGDENVPGQGPFRGWQDFAERLWKPRFEAAGKDQAKMPWLYLYRNLQTGRDNAMEMGTAPVTFVSGPLVEIRAGASRSRSVVAPGVAAREEILCIAAAVPGFTLEHSWETQEQLEEAFQLDRRAPFWVTTPINLGALQVDARGGGDQGNDPAARYFPHVVPMAFSGMGFGGPRFPAQDPADSGITAATAVAVPRPWRGETFGHDSFSQAIDPRGRDVTKEGAYQMQNIGPRGGAGGNVAASARHDRISFPFSNQFGFMGRFGTSFWLQPQTLDGVTLLDHGDGDPDRNRLAVLGRDSNLVFEVIDEAGLDPDYSQSPAGVERTASQWSVPIAEIGLPADTPVHLSVAAFGGRPSELSFTVDGLPRGKGKYMTYLTAAIKTFDPSLGNNQGLPPQSGNDRYFDLQVESTDGFPAVGILRIGNELFEYTSIRGNTFQCQWRDSIGGRGARQIGREFRPDIPVDANGKATVDIDALRGQGVNLDVFPEHPAGALVELYGYSALLAEDSPMMPGTTSLEGTVGGFAVARGFIQNPRSITIPLQGRPLRVGDGIDQNWTGELELADPLPGRTYPPAKGQTSITDGFPTGGGYALLVQRRLEFESNIQGTVNSTASVGGVELIRYSSRNGNKLTGVQRAQTLPGQDTQIDKVQYDGTARQFVTDWEDWPWSATNSQVLWDDIPTMILWVVPVSIPVQSASVLWDPATTPGGLTEWVQLYNKDVENDTEWVRYDAIAGNKHLVRGNRAAWERTRYELTQSNGLERIQIGQLGPGSTPTGLATAVWGTLTATSGYIGYIPQLEADFPQIQAARRALQFRGDPFTGTSSHAQTNAVVMQCQRLQLNWGNYGAFTGRTGRQDRVAIVQGSIADGTKRPLVEWHTVNWSCRRYQADNLTQDQAPPERLGPWPFQLCAFKDGVKGQFLGPARGAVVQEARMYDRVVKFPSGELPAAYSEFVTLGGGVGNQGTMRGFVDEVDVVQHENFDLVVDEAFNASAKVFRVNPGMTYTSVGPVFYQNDLSANFPEGGGLLWIDGELLAYQSRKDGEFTIATNGRGLLGTEARDHDRGACVHFMTHRPAAILNGGVGTRDAVLAVQSLASMPRSGTVLLGRELLHYGWMRQVGDAGTLEMPQWYPPGEDGTSASARGLFRGRFGTAAAGASAGEAVISWPFRYWDRYAEFSDDPELAYFQFTVTEAPSFYRTLTWKEETQDALVAVACLGRTDSKAPWTADPATTPGLWSWKRSAGNDEPSLIGAQASRFEVRFAVVYKPGAVDVITGKAHAWKTTARIEKVRVQYDGQSRIFDQRVTAK